MSGEPFRRSSWFCAAVATAFALAAALPARPAAADVKDDCAKAAERGQALMRSGKLSLARAELVSCARAECPRIVRSDCGPWLIDLDRMMPSVVVRAHDARGRDVIGVRVTVDSHVVADRLDGTPIAVDPGEHLFHYEAQGAPAIDEQVLVAQGEKDRVLSPRFDAWLAPDGSRVERPAPVAAASAEPRRVRLPVAAAVSGAVGVLALAGFTALEVLAQHDKASLDGGCGQTGTCAPDDVDALRGKFVAAGVTLGVGLAALSVAIVLVVLDWRAGSRPTAPTATAAAPALIRF